MATFDTLIDDLASRFGLGANARSLVREVLTMISTSSGGLGGFLDKLKSAGLSSEVTSWLGHPDASPIAAGQVERALGATALGGIASKLGLAQSAVADRARIRPAENRWPFDAGRRRSRWRPRGGRSFSLAATTSRSRSGDGTGRAAAGRRLSGEHAERIRHPALAVAGARCAGRRWRSFPISGRRSTGCRPLRPSQRRRSRRRPRQRPSRRRQPRRHPRPRQQLLLPRRPHRRQPLQRRRSLRLRRPRLP